MTSSDLVKTWAQVGPMYTSCIIFDDDKTLKINTTSCIIFDDDETLKIKTQNFRKMQVASFFPIYIHIQMSTWLIQ